MSGYDLKLREHVLAAIDEGRSQQEVAKQFGMSDRTVRRYLRLAQATGSVAARPHAGGPPKLLSGDDTAVLAQLRADDPQATLGVLASRLEERRGVRASTSMIARTLKSMGLRHIRPRRTRASLVRKVDKPVSRKYTVGPVLQEPQNLGRRAYPTDLSDAQWGILKPLIPTCKPGGRPERWSRRELVNAMLYIVRNGNTWRSLPHDLPPWSTVYSYFRKWRISGLWAKINDELRRQTRRQAGRSPSPTAVVMDSQSAHTTEKGGPMVGTATNA